MAERFFTPIDSISQSKPRTQGQSLTDSELSLSKTMFESGVPSKVIALRVGATRESIDRWARHCQWTRPGNVDFIEGEEWRPVVGREGQYSVSNKGRIRRELSIGGSRPRQTLSQCNTNRKGYFRIRFCQNGTNSMASIHSVVCAAFIGPRPNGFQINHRDGNKGNNCIENLEYATSAENIQHAIRTGLKPILRGERHGNAIYTHSQVSTAKAMLRDGILIKIVSRETGIHPATLHLLRSGKRWKHVE